MISNIKELLSLILDPVLVTINTNVTLTIWKLLNREIIIRPLLVRITRHATWKILSINMSSLGSNQTVRMSYCVIKVKIPSISAHRISKLMLVKMMVQSHWSWVSFLGAVSAPCLCLVASLLNWPIKMPRLKLIMIISITQSKSTLQLKNLQTESLRTLQDNPVIYSTKLLSRNSIQSMN